MTLKQIYEIALVKSQDKALRNMSLQGVCKSLIHSAHSIGIKIINDRSEQGGSQGVAGG